MINERMYQLGSQPNMIRKLYAYGLDRKVEVGEENVFDYSIGNPSIPAPDAPPNAALAASIAFAASSSP